MATAGPKGQKVCYTANADVFFSAAWRADLLTLGDISDPDHLDTLRRPFRLSRRDVHTQDMYQKPCRFETCRKSAFYDGLCSTLDDVAPTIVFEHCEKGAREAGIL